MAYFLSDDLQMFYIKKGEGVPLVFIHGLGSNHDIWKNQISALEKQFTVIAADSRYHGSSTVNGGAFSAYKVERIAADWISLLKFVLKREAYLIGLSLGSAVCMQIAVDYPELIAGLILVEPWASCDDEHRSRLINWIDMFSNDENASRFNKTLVQHYFSTPFIRDFSEKVKEYETIRNEQSLQVNLQDCRACLEFDIRARLSEIKAPTMLIYGEFDVLIPPYHSKLLMKEIPRAYQIRIKDCGHLPLIEREEDFNNIIRNFVSAHEIGENQNRAELKRS